MEAQKPHPHISEIPAELLIIIFEELPDFYSLVSTIQTCRRLHQCFILHNECIITSIASNIHQHAIQLGHHAEQDFHNSGPSLIIRQLIFASKMKCMPRHILSQFFKDAWTSLEKTEDLRNLLRHVGTSVGIVRERRLQPGFPLLKVQQEMGKKLYERDVSTRRRKFYIRPRTPVALITDDGMLFFKSTVYIPDGMYHESGFTLIRMTNTWRSWRIHRRSELNDVTRRQPKLCRLLNTLDKLRIMQRENYN